MVERTDTKVYNNLLEDLYGNPKRRFCELYFIDSLGWTILIYPL